MVATPGSNYAARTLAHNVATDGQSEANADPLVRISIEGLARVAELHVTEATGISSASPPLLTPVGRGPFALQLLDAWAPVLQRMVDAQRSAPAADPTSQPADPFGEPDAGGAPAFEALIGRFATTMGPVLMGMQFGSAAGHLAQRALGQYAPVVPGPPPGNC